MIVEQLIDIAFMMQKKAYIQNNTVRYKTDQNQITSQLYDPTVLDEQAWQVLYYLLHRGYFEQLTDDLIEYWVELDGFKSVLLCIFEEKTLIDNILEVAYVYSKSEYYVLI